MLYFVWSFEKVVVVSNFYFKLPLTISGLGNCKVTKKKKLNNFEIVFIKNRTKNKILAVRVRLLSWSSSPLYPLPYLKLSCKRNKHESRFFSTIPSSSYNLTLVFPSFQPHPNSPVVNVDQEYPS